MCYLDGGIATSGCGGLDILVVHAGVSSGVEGAETRIDAVGTPSVNLCAAL